MSLPVDPDSGRSSVRRGTGPIPAADSTARDDVTPAEVSPPVVPQPITVNFPQSSPSDDSSPTVISTSRPKHSSPDVAHAESLAGRRLGQYELLESIGVGGMAAVIKAQDLDLGRTVALKILPPDMATDPENITRFKQEARAAAKLDHENVARVYYCGSDQGLFFISFEFVEGEDLRKKMDKNGGVLPVVESVHYLIQIAAGLSHAASRGVVHRDIKPSNIVITPEGKAKIVDMGLARNLDPKASNGPLTHSGVTLGTFDYISPEQAIEPRAADTRSDLYSLGCTFYHILTGYPPVPEGTAAKKLHFQQHVAPVDPRSLNPMIPDELAAILGRLMQKDPQKRYQHPDHLLQHLLALAEKLQLPSLPAIADSTIRNRIYPEPALPAPPRWSVWGLALAAAVVLVGVYALSGGFSSHREPIDQRPTWETEKNNKALAANKNLPPVATPGIPLENPGSRPIREAKTVQEFAQLLKQSAIQIKLRPGAVYDLTKLPRKDADSGSALFVGEDLLIECDRPGEPPTVRLYNCAPDDGNTPRLGSFTVRSRDGGASSVKIRGVRFEFVDLGEPDPNFVGISCNGIDQLAFEECWFVPPTKGGSKPGAAALAMTVRGEPLGPVAARFKRCYFAPGSVGLRLDGRAEIAATECAFAPQASVFQFQSSTDAKPIELLLDRCTALLRSGCLIELADQVACRIEVGRCLFSSQSIDPGEPGVLVHQLGERSPATHLEGTKNDSGTFPNGYHAVRAYLSGEQSFTFAECKQEGIPIEDAGARFLTVNPFADDQPLARLAANPRQIKSVFALNTRLPDLRLEPDPTRQLLGTMVLPGVSSFYDLPFGPPSQEKALASNVKIWQPDLPKADAKAPYYASLSKAVADLEPGDVILVRAKGLVEVEPQELAREKTSVTIRADDGFRPIFVAPEKASSLKNEPALFKLFGGKLTLEGIAFRIKPNRGPKAVVALPGGGECILRDCTVTLEDANDLAVVTMPDPRGEMMMTGGPEKTTPSILLENVFIRGRGDALHVRASRTFSFKAKNSLVVLDGSFLQIDPSSADVTGLNPAEMELDRLTTYLTKHLVQQKALEKKAEAKGLGLVGLNATATNCLFAPAGESHAALVALERLEGSDQLERAFVWKKESRRNLYGYQGEDDVMDIRSEGENMIQMERFGKDRWLSRWKETEYAFGEIQFKLKSESRIFFGVQPGDFELKSVIPPIPQREMTQRGPKVDLLRKLFVDE